MPHPLLIGLSFSYSMGICRAILRGVRQFAQERPEWVFLPVPPYPRAAVTLKQARPAGLIAHVFTREQARALKSLRCPLVNTCGLVPLSFPRVGVDDHKVGALAAQHLAGLGLDHFGFVGHERLRASVLRLEGFRAALKELNVHPPAYLAPGHTGIDPYAQSSIFDAKARPWLKQLPKPAGIFVANDIWGIQLSELCRQVQLRVPEDVAILGVDNDDFLCELARPSLSSVELPGERLGFEAAARLDKLLRGNRAQTKPLLLPPTGVCVRQSTDLLAVNDPEVAAALKYIRANVGKALQVRDLVAQVNLSRRSLERRFMRELGRGIWEELRRAKMERARSLLAHTALPMPEVARQAGFSDAKQLSTVFRQESGQTPTAFRHQVRLK